MDLNGLWREIWDVAVSLISSGEGRDLNKKNANYTKKLWWYIMGFYGDIIGDNLDTFDRVTKK